MNNKVSSRMTNEMTVNVAHAISPLLWLNRILGLAIFEIPTTRPWPKLSLLYSLGRSVAYGYLMYYVVFTLPIPENPISIMIAVLKLIYYVNVVIAVISTVFQLYNYKKGKGFLKKVALADETLEVFGIDPEYESAFTENLRIVLIWVTIGISIFASEYICGCYIYENPLMAFIRVLTYDFPLLLNPIVELNFTVKISILGKRFERLNALIQSVTTTPLQTMNLKNSSKYQNILKKNQFKVAVKSNYYFKNRNNIELLLRTARQLHLDLCATSREVNEICSIQMSLQMAATFLLLTGFTYCLYLVHNETSLPLSYKIQCYVSLGVWILASIIRMTYVVRTSVYVTTEAQKTSQIAHEIQVPRSQSKLIDEIHQLSLQIMQHPLSFTASGLVVLDFGYVRGFVGSVTTYLMILIQNQPDMLKAASTLTGSISDNKTDNASITE